MNMRAWGRFIWFWVGFLNLMVWAWEHNWGSFSAYLKEDASLTVQLHGRTVTINYGAMPNDLSDNLCSAFQWDDEQCEHTIDFIFANMYVDNVRYAPKTEVENWQREFLASRGTIIGLLQSKFGYKSYLEIGTEEDKLFSLASRRFERSVGVDPKSGGTLRMTSDQFFSQNKEYFDLIFIDGLHEAHQVYRDIVHALNWLSPDGTIVLHDCNPHGFLNISASYPMHPDATGNWNGDGWKATVSIRLWSFVEVVVVDVDHGVGVLRRRINRHPLAERWQRELLPAPLDILTNEHLRNYRHELVRLVSVQGMLDFLDE